MPPKPSSAWQKAARDKVVPLSARPQRPDAENPGAPRFPANLPLDTVLGAVLLVLAPFGAWKLFELFTRHLP